MIGFVVGLVVAFGLISSGWNPSSTDSPALFLSLAGGLLVGGLALGLFLIPRTVGIACINIFLGAMLAALAALIRGHGVLILPMLAIAAAALVCQMIVGNVRRDAT